MDGWILPSNSKLPESDKDNNKQFAINKQEVCLVAKQGKLSASKAFYLAYAL